MSLFAPYPACLSVGIVDALQERFRKPQWALVDELATYIQEAFETTKAQRGNESGRQQAQANDDVATYTAMLIVFTAGCVLM